MKRACNLRAKFRYYDYKHDLISVTNCLIVNHPITGRIGSNLFDRVYSLLLVEVVLLN